MVTRAIIYPHKVKQMNHNDWDNDRPYTLTRTYTLAKHNVELKRSIYVKGEYEGFHTWDNAPEEVAFLRNNHRHLFKWMAEIDVRHDDRELEFFMVKTFLDREVLPFTRMMGNLGSCEQQAERILEGLVNKYGADRFYSVSVSEDGENGARVVWDPDY